MTMNRRARTWFAMCLLVVFGAGVGTGLLLHASIESASVASTQPSFSKPTSVKEIAALITKECQLDDARRRRVEAIMDARRQRLAAFHEEVQQRISTERLEVMGEIRSVMTTEQQRLFDAFVARMRAQYPKADWRSDLPSLRP